MILPKNRITKAVKILLNLNKRNFLRNSWSKSRSKGNKKVRSQEGQNKYQFKFKNKNKFMITASRIAKQEKVCQISPTLWIFLPRNKIYKLAIFSSPINRKLSKKKKNLSIPIVLKNTKSLNLNLKLNLNPSLNMSQNLKVKIGTPNWNKSSTFLNKSKRKYSTLSQSNLKNLSSKIPKWLKNNLELSLKVPQKNLR